MPTFDVYNETGIFCNRINALYGTNHKPSHNTVREAWKKALDSDPSFYSKFMRQDYLRGPNGKDHVVAAAVNRHGPSLAKSTNTNNNNNGTNAKNAGTSNNTRSFVQAAKNATSSNANNGPKGKGKGKGKSRTTFADLEIPTETNLFFFPDGQPAPILKDVYFGSSSTGVMKMAHNDAKRAIRSIGNGDLAVHPLAMLTTM